MRAQLFFGTLLACVMSLIAVVPVLRASGTSKIYHCWDHNGYGPYLETCDISITDGSLVIWRACTGEYGSRRILECSIARYDGA